jgi:ribosomal protein S18 acetylase RimI-like enzyme
MTIRISEFAQKHLADITRLLTEEYKNSYEFIPFSEEVVSSQIRRRNLKILVAEENGNVLGLVGTRLEERGEENIMWLAAREGPHRKTIENMLVNEVEKKAKSDTISVGIDEGSPRIIDWIEGGYSLNPGWLRMCAKLDNLTPVPTVTQDIKLRSLALDEEEKLVEVINTGFGWRRLEVGVLENWRTEDPPFDEEWVQVGEIGERIVSAVVARPDTEYNKYLDLNRGYLGPAATLPEFRNKHLASALTARAMNSLRDKGYNSVRLGTSELNTSSIILLKSLGFQVEAVRKVLRKQRNPPNVTSIRQAS